MRVSLEVQYTQRCNTLRGEGTVPPLSSVHLQWPSTIQNHYLPISEHECIEARAYTGEVCHVGRAQRRWMLYSEEGRMIFCLSFPFKYLHFTYTSVITPLNSSSILWPKLSQAGREQVQLWMLRCQTAGSIWMM